MLLFCAKAFSEGTSNASVMDTQILQLHRNIGGRAGRQTLMVALKERVVGEGRVFALGENGRWTKKWVQLEP